MLTLIARALPEHLLVVSLTFHPSCAFRRIYAALPHSYLRVLGVEKLE